MLVDLKNLEIELAKVDLNEETILKYKGREYWINPKAAPGHGYPSSWYRSTDYSGADVYIWSNMDRIIIKPFTCHEVIEADLEKHERESGSNAHVFANALTDDYARRTLNDKALDIYFKIKEDLYIKAWSPLVIPDEVDFFSC